MVSPGMVKPSMAMKCITQMPVIPIEPAPSSSQRTLEPPELTCDRLVERRPRNEPTTDIRYARPGVSRP
jgi:hypothetical protein